MANKGTKEVKTGDIDPRWTNDTSEMAFSKTGKPRRSMPKFIQGATYLHSTNLVVVFKYKEDAEYDPISDIVDKKQTNDVSIIFSNGTVTLTYKNWKSKVSQNREFLIVFGSGYTKKITLKLPGLKSKLIESIDTITSTLTSAPHQNFLSLDFETGKQGSTNILGSVYRKSDPYNVFNYSGVFTHSLPYAYYVNSVDINEILVDANVTSTTKDVIAGNSPRGVGNIYPGAAEQEIHFINVHSGVNTNITNNNELLNLSNNAPFVYGFIYSKNLLDISDLVRKFYVCKNKGEAAYYQTTAKDCDDVTIPSNYLQGNKEAKFLNGGCCTRTCEDFSIQVEDLTVQSGHGQLQDNDGYIKVTVVGGAESYTYSITEGSTYALAAVSTPSVTTTESTHTFSNIGYTGVNQPPFLIKVTDANGCVSEVYIRLANPQDEYIVNGCRESDAFNQDTTLSANAINVDNCFYCKDVGSRGESYKAISFGSSASAVETGIDLISNDGAQIYHATTSGTSNGRISFKGSLFPAAVQAVLTDSPTYTMKFYSLGTLANSNDKTKAEILALSATSTLTDADVNNEAFEKEYTNLATGWYAISCYITGVTTVAACNSVHRFYVGYGGCTDPNAENYDKEASYHNQELCTYNCPETELVVVKQSTSQACVKSLSVKASDKEFETVTWTIGGETKHGYGPHFAVEGDYVNVYRENSKTRCSQSAEFHIKETGCKDKSNPTLVVRSLWFQEAASTGGCTDSTSVNYDCDALWDDGSCVAPIPGCTDQQAWNYDNEANLDNGNCIFGIPGCRDYSALNYNPLATIPVNDECEWCPGIGTQWQNFDIHPGPTQFNWPDQEAAMLAGTWDALFTGPLTISNLQINFDNAWGVMPSNIVARIWKIPLGTGTIDGYSQTDHTFPLAQSEVPALAEIKLTGTDSPFFQQDISLFASPTEGNWNDDGSVPVLGIMAWTVTGSIDLGVEAGHGYYICELEIPWFNATTMQYTSCFRRIAAPSINPNSGNNGFGSYNLSGAAESGIANAGSWQFDMVPDWLLGWTTARGCIDPLASNYTTAGASSIGFWWQHAQQQGVGQQLTPGDSNMYMYSSNWSDSPWGIAENFPENWYYQPNEAGARGWCEYDLESPTCLPVRLESKIAYITDCNINSIGNWYNELITGMDTVGEKGLWMTLFIEYLLKRRGLECIYNCTDSGTPDYPDFQTCEEQWIASGSRELEVTTPTLQVTGNYSFGEIVKVTTAFPNWYGDVPTNSLHIVRTNCGTDCRNPLGTGYMNWMPCIDKRKITETTNYLDIFFKFANDYCRSCSPCSYLPGNNPISTEACLTHDVNSSAVTGNLTYTIGGINIEVDGDDVADGQNEVTF